MKRFLWVGLGFLLATGCVTIERASAGFVTDDLTDGSFSSDFNYDFDLSTAGIQSIAATSNDFLSTGDFAELNSSALLLAADAVEITFNLQPGQFANDATVTGNDFIDSARASVTFIGLDTGGNPLSRIEDVTDRTFTSIASNLGNFASVDTIQIRGFETQVFSVSINAVPEPSLAPCLVAAATLLSWRRRRPRSEA